MDIRNCKRCNRIFQYIGNKYCPNCMLELDKMFITVRDYIYDHPEANVIQASQETGVDEEVIFEFLKQGRLQLSEPSLDYVCERCEKPITSGRYCHDCINELDREMKKGLSEASQNSRQSMRDSTRMHISDYHLNKRKK